MFSPGPQAEGPLGSFDLDDIKGIARDPISDIWYAVQRIDGGTSCGRGDILFQFNPQTGAYIDGAFSDMDFNGSLDDYVVIRPPSGEACHHIITDLTYDPFNARIYGIATGLGIYSNSSRLVQIDPEDGSTTDRGLIAFDDGSGLVNISDIQGVSITTNDRMFITTGTLSNFPNQLFEITDYFIGTIITSFIDNLNRDDYQAITCQTFATLTSIGELVYRDVNANGSLDIGEPGISGVEVHLVQSVNRDTIATRFTDVDGFYYFQNVYPGEYEVIVSNNNFLLSGPLANHIILGDPDAEIDGKTLTTCLLYTSPSPRDATLSRMPSSA